MMWGKPTKKLQHIINSGEESECDTGSLFQQLAFQHTSWSGRFMQLNDQKHLLIMWPKGTDRGVGVRGLSM